MRPEDAILLPEIVDEIFLVAIHPASQSQHEEVQSVEHGRRLHGSDAAVTHVVSRIHSPRPFSRTIRDVGTVAGLELGRGYAVSSAVRLEALVAYRPRFTFDGRANFLDPDRRQSVSADLAALSGILAPVWCEKAAEARSVLVESPK